MSSQSSESDIPIDANIAELAALTSGLSDLVLSNTAANDEPPTKHRKSIDELLLETFECLQNKRHSRLSWDTLASWSNFGERNVSFDLNTKYADEELVKRLYSTYLEYEQLSESGRRSKKQIANPLEAVKKGFLMNRSAIKFASIDSLLDYMFSDPVDKLGRSLIQPNELMYFVDIGGGPGGFVDYLLWRRDWQTKGFGIPMKGCNYWNSGFAVGGQRFNIFKGAKRDGDVTNEENITSIVRYVKQHISLGVHVVMTDAAFDVKKPKYAKETIFKRMYLGEVILALSLLRANGHFIMKLFDVLLPFTVGLIYLMHKCFAEIILIKPKTSRPSSAERYLICKWKYSDTENVRMYLEHVNQALNRSEAENFDVIQLVPEDVLLSDKEFFNFIYQSNNLIAERQTEGMLEMLQLRGNCAVESPDPSLVEKCLQQWNVLPKTETVFDCTFGPWAKIVDAPENTLHPSLPLRDSFNLPGDNLGNEWHCIRVENIDTGNRTFFSTASSTEVKMLDPISSEWIAVTDIGLAFPTNTFVYGEIVNHHVHHSDNAPSHGFHIIDGLILNGQDIRSHPYSMRLELCKKFADAINNPSHYIKTQNGKQIRAAAVNCKESFLLKNLIREMEQFRKSWKTTQTGSKVLGQNVHTCIGPKRFYAVNGLLFLRNFTELTDETNFDETFRCRQLWKLDGPEILNTVDIDKTPADGNVYLAHFCEYMNKRVDAPNWRDKGKPRIPSRYSNNRGGASGKSPRNFRK